MERTKDHIVDERPNSAFLQGSSPNGVDLSGQLSAPEGGEKTDLGRSPHQVRRNPPPQSPNRYPGTHRRFKSHPSFPQAPVGYFPSNARTPGYRPDQDEGQFHPQLPMYNTWMVPAASYESQWSAYGMYVFNSVLSRRSEQPTRILFIGNLAPSVEEKRIIEAAAKYGPLRGVDASSREYWYGIFVSFWDLRHAEEALRGLPEAISGAGAEDGQQIPVTVFFMLPPDLAGMENQGTIHLKTKEGVTINDLRKLLGNYGEIKSIRNLTEELKSIEFYDARAAEAAIHELKSPKYSNIIIEVEYSKFTHLRSEESVGGGALDPEMSQHGVNAMWPTTTGSFVPNWGQYPGPQNYPPERRLHRQNSAPAASYNDRQNAYSMRRADAVWNGHYMTYPPPHGMQPWGFANNPPPRTVAMMPGSGRVGNHVHRVDNLPGSPGFESHGSETPTWRPHRTRSAGERVYDPAQFQFNLAEAKSDPSIARTTLMIRNIPNKYSQKMLLDVLNKRYR